MLSRSTPIALALLVMPPVLAVPVAAAAAPAPVWTVDQRVSRIGFASSMGGGRYQAIGTLSLRGVTRPLTLAFQLRIQGKQARMQGSTTIDRHAFGVGQGQFAGAESVPFAVRVTVSVAATRA